MREIVFDTETTGLDPFTGDRLVEIGCSELLNRFPTGKTFHANMEKPSYARGSEVTRSVHPTWRSSKLTSIRRLLKRL